MERAAAVTEAPAKASAGELLNGIPHLHPMVAMEFDPRRGPTLVWDAPRPRGLLGMWFAARLDRLFGRPRRRIALDGRGARTVELIDGKRSAVEIACVLAREQGVGVEQAGASVLAFLTELARRNVVTVLRHSRCSRGALG